MSNKFKVGDVVVRKPEHIDEHSICKCRQGVPVKVECAFEDGGLGFKDEDGGLGFEGSFFDLYTPAQEQEQQITIEQALAILTNAGYKVILEKKEN